MTVNLNSWGFVSPESPRIPAVNVMGFLNEAPVGTVISVDGDISRKISEDTWRHLEDLVNLGDYCSLDTWDEDKVSNLNWFAYETTEVRALHIPS